MQVVRYMSAFRTALTVDWVDGWLGLKADLHCVEGVTHRHHSQASCTQQIKMCMFIYTPCGIEHRRLNLPVDVDTVHALSASAAGPMHYGGPQERAHGLVQPHPQFQQ